MLPQWVIEKKRDGEVLSEEEIHSFLDGFSTGEIPDYQMAALAMAICLKGMNFEETTALTKAMLESGEILDFEECEKAKVDKHSTGGIGDKTSLVLAPLVASCGLAVPMISGRGLGITGGTLDKLEAIPGFRTDLGEQEVRDVVASCGCVISGATANLAPADKKLYALRDVTGTVPSVALITASILSKKLSAQLDALVLDVKWGSGAFMKTEAEAKQLAEVLSQTSQNLDTPATALLTAMNQPLGRAAGNALEIVEVIEVLKGDGPADLVELIIALGERMLAHGKVAKGQTAIDLLKQKLESGKALEKFQSMAEAQGGDPRAVENPEILPNAPIVHAIPAQCSGYLENVDAETIGRVCLALGAGRKVATDCIDPAVGISAIRKIGDKVEQGETLALVHANNADALKLVLPWMSQAFETSENPVKSPSLISDMIEGKKKA
ncbi:MAG: thymidine phosphorylase [Opitutae bacterium]|nr:thymidine phosphorylase [Opitutae bacterium]